jgi:hypothetical protein
MKTTKRNTTWKRKIEIMNTLKSNINYIFRSAKEKHTKHQTILDNLHRSPVYGHKDYVFLTNYMRSEINGYIWANFDLMYSFVDWVHWYKGEFVGKELPYGSDFDNNAVESAHCYKGTEDVYTERKKA